MAPGADGIELLREFRKRHRATPVLFLTARDAVSNRVEGLDARRRRLSVQAVLIRGAIGSSRRLLRRHDQSSAVTIEYGDIRADLASQRAVRRRRSARPDGQGILAVGAVSPPPGTILSRTPIYESVWGDQYDGLSNTIEVHVKELHRKLEETRNHARDSDSTWPRVHPRSQQHIRGLK